MICPLDQQPCTMDHSTECRQNCERQRQMETDTRAAIRRSEELAKGL